MADRRLRGSGIGAKYPNENPGVELAARREVSYDCPKGHHFTIVFAEEADIPFEWGCPRCGEEGRRSDVAQPEAKEIKPPRTHWDMLRERRSIPELEELLAERLGEIRNSD